MRPVTSPPCRMNAVLLVSRPAMITSPSPLAATVEPMVAVPTLMTRDSRTPSSDHRHGQWQLHRAEPLPGRSCPCHWRLRGPRVAGVCKPHDGVLEDRQQTVGEQGNQGRFPPKADQGHGEREDGNRRKGLPDIDQGPRQRQEFAPPWGRVTQDPRGPPQLRC